jgi:hypothetical protein
VRSRYHLHTSDRFDKSGSKRAWFFTASMAHLVAKDGWSKIIFDKNNWCLTAIQNFKAHWVSRIYCLCVFPNDLWLHVFTLKRKMECCNSRSEILGCQMLYSETKKYQFCRTLNGNFWYVSWHFGAFNTIWYVLYPFGTFCGYLA